MDYSEQKRLIAEISAKHPIPPDRVYPGDSEAQEQAAVRSWVQKSMIRSSAPAATAGVEATCDLVVAITKPIIESLQRQIVELEARCRLSEQRATGLEERCGRVEERMAKVEDRAFGPLSSGALAHSGKTH